MGTRAAFFFGLAVRFAYRFQNSQSTRMNGMDADEGDPDRDELHGWDEEIRMSCRLMGVGHETGTCKTSPRDSTRPNLIEGPRWRSFC